MLETTFRSIACGLFFAATAVQAGPQPERIAEILADSATATGRITLTHEAATANGDDVTITGLTITDAADGSTANVPAMVIGNPQERQTGGFAAVSIAFNNGAATSIGGLAVAWRTAVVEDAIIPSPDEVKARADLRPFRKLSLGGVTITHADIDEPIEIASLTIDIGQVSGEAPSDILMKATGARLPVAMITNPIGRAMMEGLGYSAFLADVTLSSDYDSAADAVTIQSLTIDAADVGRIVMAARFSGLSLRGLANPDEAAAAAARAALRLDHLTVRFEDAGVVLRMLDMQGRMLGGTRDEVREQLVSGVLPFAVSFVDNERFRDQFLAAAAAFLENPRSLTITATPNPPVPLGQLWRAATRTPLALPDLLSPDVVANN